MKIEGLFVLFLNIFFSSHINLWISFLNLPWWKLVLNSMVNSFNTNKMKSLINEIWMNLCKLLKCIFHGKSKYESIYT